MSLTLPLFLLAAAFVSIYVYLKQHYAYWARRNVPHEPPVYLFGNMRGLGRDYHWRDINRRIYKRFKRQHHKTPIVGFYTFFNRAAFVMDLELIKQILIKDFSSFADRGLFHNVRDDPLTGNLLFLDGEPWRILRHKLSPVFTTGKIKYMFHNMSAVGEQLTAACRVHIEQEIEHQHLHQHQHPHQHQQKVTVVIDVKDLCARYTTDVIGTCAFGIECNSLRDPQTEFRRMGRSIFEQPRHSAPIQAWMFAAPHWARTFRMKNFKDEVTAFFMNVIRATVAYREQNYIKRHDFMDMLLELKAKRDVLKKTQKQEQNDDLNNGLTFEQLAAQAMIFFLAGFETSSTTLAFCLYELALNQQVQTKLRAEILNVLHKHDDKLNYDCIKEMTYLEQVVCETLRKYSVLPHLVRKTTKLYRIPATDIVLEPGTTVMIPIDSIHMDEDIFPEPDEFQPERFAPAEIAKRHAYAYLPFGDGPRNCIGMRFGKLQTEIGLISLLRYYSFSVTPQTPIPMPISKKSFLITPAGGVHLSVMPL